MAIQGVQIIYRLKQVIRLFIDYRTGGVDSFNLYYSNTESGSYTLIGSVLNNPSIIPASRGKVVFEFITDGLTNWDNETRNYVKLAPVIDGVEGEQEGPLVILPRSEMIVPKEYSVMYGFNKELQKFIPVAVDDVGNIITSA